MEIKSSSTFRPELLKGLKRLRELSPQMGEGYLVYAGEPFSFSDGIHALRFDQLGQFAVGDTHNLQLEL